MKKILSLAGVFLLSTLLFAQNITTASAYFKTISEYYASLKDYEVDYEIKVDKKESAGKISYKAPDLLRLDYTTPENQVIVFNGEMLTVYLPDSSAILEQQITGVSNNNPATVGTAQGLGLLSRYYTVAYETGQNAEPLEEGSDEMVVKFILYPKNAAETFKFIKIDVNPTEKLIRRISAVTTKGEEFTINFYEYKLNQNLTEQRFIYDPPSSANDYSNFLFSE